MMEPLMLVAFGIINILGQLHNYGIDVEKNPHLKDVRVRREIDSQPYEFGDKNQIETDDAKAPIHLQVESKPYTLDDKDQIKIEEDLRKTDTQSYTFGDKIQTKTDDTKDSTHLQAKSKPYKLEDKDLVKIEQDLQGLIPDESFSIKSLLKGNKKIKEKREEFVPKNVNDLYNKRNHYYNKKYHFQRNDNFDTANSNFNQLANNFIENKMKGFNPDLLKGVVNYVTEPDTNYKQHPFKNEKNLTVSLDSANGFDENENAGSKYHDSTVYRKNTESVHTYGDNNLQGVMFTNTNINVVQPKRNRTVVRKSSPGLNITIISDVPANTERTVNGNGNHTTNTNARNHQNRWTGRGFTTRKPFNSFDVNGPSYPVNNNNGYHNVNSQRNYQNPYQYTTPKPLNSLDSITDVNGYLIRRATPRNYATTSKRNHGFNGKPTTNYNNQNSGAYEGFATNKPLTSTFAVNTHNSHVNNNNKHRDINPERNYQSPYQYTTPKPLNSLDSITDVNDYLIRRATPRNYVTTSKRNHGNNGEPTSNSNGQNSGAFATNKPLTNTFAVKTPNSYVNDDNKQRDINLQRNYQNSWSIQRTTLKPLTSFGGITDANGSLIRHSTPRNNAFTPFKSYFRNNAYNGNHDKAGYYTTARNFDYSNANHAIRNNHRSSYNRYGYGSSSNGYGSSGNSYGSSNNGYGSSGNGFGSSNNGHYKPQRLTYPLPTPSILVGEYHYYGRQKRSYNSYQYSQTRSQGPVANNNQINSINNQYGTSYNNPYNSYYNNGPYNNIGLNANTYDYNGVNTATVAYNNGYNPNGYNPNGYNPNGYNPNTYNPYGYNNNGNNQGYPSNNKQNIDSVTKHYNKDNNYGSNYNASANGTVSNNRLDKINGFNNTKAIIVSTSTTPRTILTGQIILHIGCPQFMKYISIMGTKVCIPEKSEEDSDEFI